MVALPFIFKIEIDGFDFSTCWHVLQFPTLNVPVPRCSPLVLEPPHSLLGHPRKFLQRWQRLLGILCSYLEWTRVADRQVWKSFQFLKRPPSQNATFL